MDSKRILDMSESALVGVGDESLDEWLVQLYGVFGIEISRDPLLFEFVKAVFTGEHVAGIRDADGYVATAATVGSSISLPGGYEIDGPCLTGLSVDSTRRRQGLLRVSMDELHRHGAENGAAVTMLCPSEWGIYGRFGYGPATWFDTVVVDTRMAQWRDDAPQLDCEVRRVNDREAGRLARAIYESRYRADPGDILPPVAYWDRFEHEPAYNRIDEFLGLSSSGAVVRHCAAVSDFGVVAYRLKPGWTAEATPSYTLEVTDLLSADRNAEAALWRHILSVDLVTEVRVARMPVDHPLRWWLKDARAIRIKRHDGLWLRPLDVKVLLERREWCGNDSLTLCIHDSNEIVSGTYSLDVNEGEASCVRVGKRGEPDLEMDAGTLGAIVLGGTSARSLGASGMIWTKDATTPRRWDALATPDRSPFTRYPL